ncbi:hypothetical protein [Methanofollis aquaemaris]|uniref:hypothetical protein n=1 Tax=Methanofollis aquaemaris TaxID=126734 RepID=UPI00223EE301|nr:hypothetical protein [Methanofollis aquaemaris]
MEGSTRIANGLDDELRSDPAKRSIPVRSRQNEYSWITPGRTEQYFIPKHSGEIRRNNDEKEEERGKDTGFSYRTRRRREQNPGI